MDTDNIPKLESLVKMVKEVAAILRWGTLEIEFKDGKAVMVKVTKHTILN
jgi:hypothetical protein